MKEQLTILLAVHFASTWFMVGLIWFVQVVHYPLFSKASPSDFAGYQRAHQHLTTRVVAPIMLLEAITALFLLLRLGGIYKDMLIIGALLLTIIWISTVVLQVPQHRVLAKSFDVQAHRKLVATNWIRTACWTLRGGLVFALLLY